MCASCVAQGVAYVGGSVGILRVMAYRAAQRRASESSPPGEAEPPELLSPPAWGSDDVPITADR